MLLNRVTIEVTRNRVTGKNFKGINFQKCVETITIDFIALMNK